MIDQISQNTHAVHSRVIQPSHEALLRTDKQPDSAQTSKQAIEDTQIKKAERDERVQERRVDQRKASSERASRDEPSYSVRHTSSQASQLSDKLLESVRESRREQMKAERAEEAPTRANRPTQMERAYQPAGHKDEPSFVDEIV